MRLALVIHAIQCGGAERVLVTMANYWAAKGWEIILLTFDDGSQTPFYPLDSRIQHLCLNVPILSTVRHKAYWEFWVKFSKLRQSLREVKPDVVISFIDITNIFSIAATLGLGIPVIVSERIDPHFYNIGKKWDTLRSWMYPLADQVVVQTQRVAEYFSHKTQSKIAIIPNPVLQPNNDRSEFSITIQKPSIVSVGRLVYQKGHDILIEVFAKIHEQHKDWSLTIVGEGPLRQNLMSMIQQYGLENSVFLPGVAKDLVSIFKQTDIFVLPSRYEGFPNVLCEAMACGLAVISTNCPSGPSDIVRNQVDGLLVANEDAEALTQALKRLILNPEERQTLASRASEIVKRFSLDSIMEEWEKLLEKVIR